MAAEEITSDAITADYRILQRRRGHRYSLDDLAVAWEASQVRPRAMQYVDLGCGIGSVLLMVAWKLADAQTFGVEALQLSADLATRSLALNGLETRASIIVGDLREVARKWPHGSCELVTGTPPYLPKGTALESPDPQRAAARIELRGGVEDYLAAAALLLSPDGRVVVCGDGRKPERVLDGAAACGLTALRRRDVFARAGADGPLFSIWVLARATGVDGAAFEHLSLLIRGDDGEQTSEARQLRASFGL